MQTRSAGLYAETFGEGPDVVMLHGFAMHSGLWRDFAAVLAERFRVTLVDLPGHGRSGRLKSFFLPDLADALQAVAPPRGHWIGWSLGALIALYAAWKNPARIESLVLIAGNVRFVQDETWPFGLQPERLAEFGEALSRNYPSAALHFLHLQLWNLPDVRAALKTLRARLAECPAPDAAAIEAGLTILQTADLRDALREVQRPILFLLGGKDRLVPRAAGAAMQALAPTARLHVIPSAAHLPFYSHRQETLSLITDFFRSHGRF
jgi:pimeloyl-[acyl-carrier protein] methyl ester esterase